MKSTPSVKFPSSASFSIISFLKEEEMMKKD